MANQPQKIELTEEMQKDYSALRWNIFVFAFSIVVVALILAMSVSFGVQVWYNSQREPRSTHTNGTLDQATWAVQSANSSASADGTISLTLVSSIGNIRTYSGVRSYGLSNDGKTLALSTETNFRFVDLASDEERELLLPFAYSGDRGEAITWSPDNQEIAMIISNDTEGGADILLVLDADGEEVARVADDFAYYSQGGEKVYFPAKFSPQAKLILTRTFEDEAARAELDPANLKVYNIVGGVRKEIAVRDAVPTPDQLIYFWSTDGDTVLYKSTELGVEPDYGKEYAFEQAFVDF